VCVGPAVGVQSSCPVSSVNFSEYSVDWTEDIEMIVHKSLVEEIHHSVHIDYGYRKTKSVYDTFMTLFSFHNESMNIWSHLIGFICVCIAGINITLDLHLDEPTTTAEYYALETYIICAAICLFFSTIYHWFGCISEECHQCLLKLDLSGIALLVAGSFLPAVYYGKLLLIVTYCGLNLSNVCIIRFLLCT
jgi:adiponectin receptor